MDDPVSNVGLASDLLKGADKIAEFVFGNANERRKVYHLANDTKKNRLPTFKIGSTLCARRTTLLRWVEQQEAAANAA